MFITQYPIFDIFVNNQSYTSVNCFTYTIYVLGLRFKTWRINYPCNVTDALKLATGTRDPLTIRPI